MPRYTNFVILAQAKELDITGNIRLNHCMVGVMCKMCDKSISRYKSAIEPTNNTFCSSACFAAYNNKHRTTKLSLERSIRQRSRPLCANPECSIRIGLNNKLYCSSKCKLFSEKEKSRLSIIKNIQIFAKKYGRIPIKYELPTLSSKARYCFGTWNKAIKAAGFMPNEVIFSKKFIANDGHICDSLSEKIIDDWLFARKINHEIHVKYPWNNGMSADFKVGDCWVEFFGLAGQLKRYDYLKNEKLSLIKKYKLKKIYLYLSDIFPVSKLDQKLKLLK